MNPQEINERLCKLMYDVWRRIDPNATTANDCHCNRGGLWGSPNYGLSNFRNDGKALEFIEIAVREKLSRMDKCCFRKEPADHEHEQGCPERAVAPPSPPAIVRCPSVSKQGLQCGLDAGHKGNHCALTPDDAKWRAAERTVAKE